MKLRGPKVKIARQLGIALTPKAARIMENRPSPPGQHGAAMKRKVSEYKKQLIEKQRLRAQYNVSERQLRNLVATAFRREGNTGITLMQLLEMRLDALIFRAGFTRTIFAARQAVAHGHVLVNGRRCSVPSRRIELSDIVALAPRSRDMACFMVPLETARPPAYLDLDRDRRQVRMTTIPERDQIPVICETSLVVEFYSR